MSNSPAGKTDLPREGQYSKKNRDLYGLNYDRIFGVKCTVCNGRGYAWDMDQPIHLPVKKITCVNCNGTGTLKG